MAWLKNNYQFEFTDTLTTSWTSVRISNEKENGAVTTFTNQYITVRSEDNSIVERMKGSAAAWVLTLTMRWLDQSDTDTQDAGLKRERREWSKAFVTYVASQHVDPRDDNTFAGTQTFNNVIVSQDITIWDDISVAWDTTLNGKYKWPVVADVTARDALYPAPVWWNEVFVQSLNAKQVYNAGTVQRETQAVGTPAPDASEIVKGILPLATNAEAITGSNDTKAMTPLKTKAAIDNNWSSLKETSTILLWEDCLVNDSLFPETAPTFAESTLVQNIGDVTANTRIALYWFGSGVSWNTMKLALRKFVSPSADLSIRLETLDGSGNATGTLVNANSTSTVTSASLTTSLVDTTVTFAWSFAITLGQKYAIVLRQVWDVVNATNYYWVGYVARDTTTRGTRTWNGTVWNIPSITTNNAHTRIFDTSGWSTQINWYRIQSNINWFLSQIIKSATSTATRALIYADNGTTLLASASFVWNIATFNQVITNTTFYRVWVDNNWSSYTSHRVFAGGYPQNYSNVNYIWWALGTGNMTTNDTSNWFDILSITTYIQVPVMFTYTNSTLTLPTLLSKTDADYTYKLPTDFPRIANEAKSEWQNVITTYLWLKWWFTGLSNTTYYASNTPWLISATAGTNPYVVGNGIDTTTLKIDWKNLNKAISVSASPFSYTNTTGWPIQVKITGGTVNPIVINGVTTATATWHINTLPAWATMTVTYTVLPTITYSDI